MSNIKVLSVFGTRPEATKMAPLIKILESDKAFESIVCITAQHRGMLDEVLDIFEINADFDLDIMKEGQSLEYITTRALVGVGEVIGNVRPDLVLVHGDTTTTFAAGLGAFYNKVKIGHVEAGLRTFNKYEPYPEEVNRKLTGVLADINFAPTKAAKKNLLKEGVLAENIFVSGNTAVDCVMNSVRNGYVFKRDFLNDIDFKNKRIILVTAHRRENLGQPLENICEAILDIVKSNKDIEIIYPVHPNPAVKNTVYNKLLNVERIHITEPLDFSDMHNLISQTYAIMTDSGGLQEEAPSLNKPVIVLRNVTERPEGIAAKTLILAGTKKDNIILTLNKLLDDKTFYKEMSEAKNPFGDGKASQRIAAFIKHYFNPDIEKPEEFNNF